MPAGVVGEPAATPAGGDRREAAFDCHRTKMQFHNPA